MTDETEHTEEAAAEPETTTAEASEPSASIPEPAEPYPPSAARTGQSEPSEASPADRAFHWGTGRRKTSVARVRIRAGEGKFVINNRDVDKFFPVERNRAAVRKPLAVTESAKSYDVFVNVTGGGVTGQTGAVLLGLARALVKANPDYAPKLRENNLLTRDPRKVERKKYGRSGARKRFQFSKR